MLQDRVNQRRANHQFYVELFKDNSHFTLHTEPTSEYYSNHWLSIVRIEAKSGITKTQLIQKFAKKNIETRPIWKPMHMQPVFKSAPYFGSNLSEKLFSSGLCLPSGSNLNDDDRQRISSILKSVMRSD